MTSLPVAPAEQFENPARHELETLLDARRKPSACAGRCCQKPMMGKSARPTDAAAIMAPSASPVADTDQAVDCELPFEQIELTAIGLRDVLHGDAPASAASCVSGVGLV
jgi:hypothetical protein